MFLSGITTFAIFMIFLIYLIITIVVYFVIFLLIRISPIGHLVNNKIRKVFLFIICLVLVCAFLIIKFEMSDKGLFE